MPPPSVSPARPLRSEDHAADPGAPHLELAISRGPRDDVEPLDLRHGSGDLGPYDSDDIEWLLEHRLVWTPDRN